MICSLAGYGFEIYHDKAKDAVMSVILLAMMVPFVTTLVPLFQMISKMKMLNSTLPTAIIFFFLQKSFAEGITGSVKYILGGGFIAVGVYNFAVASGFPVAGISGIAIVFYHFWGIPIGTMTTILNIPIILLCYKMLGKEFFLKSLKTMLISNFIMDYVVPLFPVYEGDLMLSCICMSVFSGIGYALIYIRGTSTGSADFVLMAVHKWKPHLSVGKIIIFMDFTIVILGGLLMRGDVILRHSS